MHIRIGLNVSVFHLNHAFIKAGVGQKANEAEQPEQPEQTEQSEQPEALDEPEEPAEPEAPEAEKQLEAPPEGPAVSVLSTDNRSGDFTYSVLSNDTAREAACFRRGR